MGLLNLQLIDTDELRVRILIDGDDFGLRVKESFGDEGFDDTFHWIGGDYGLNDTVFGPESLTSGKKQALLLACGGCGYAGCSSVYADVDLNEDSFQISNIRTLRKKRWLSSRVSTLDFDLAQVKSAVADIEKQISFIEDRKLGQAIQEGLDSE